MRYSETQEQSAELLRQVLPCMQGHSAAYHPHSYSIWYEHLAGINLPLSAAIDQRLNDGVVLTDNEVFELHTVFVSGRDLDLAKRMQRELYVLLDDTASDAIQASSKMEGLQARVKHSADALRNSAGTSAPTELLQQIDELCEAARDISTSFARRSQDARALGDRFTRLSTEAVIDPLTGLRNRRGFQEAIARLTQDGVDLTRAAFIMVDIDHFKMINDQHGHLLGDKVIHTVGQLLNANIKGRDVAVRLGGEEFGVLLPETHLAGAMQVAEQLRARVEKLTIQRPGKEVVGTFTISVGVSAWEPTLDALIARADGALYAAKRQGRNRVVNGRTGTT